MFVGCSLCDVVIVLASWCETERSVRGGGSGWLRDWVISVVKVARIQGLQ